jgi:hypothetical protein
MAGVMVLACANNSLDGSRFWATSDGKFCFGTLLLLYLRCCADALLVDTFAYDN